MIFGNAKAMWSSSNALRQSPEEMGSIWKLDKAFLEAVLPPSRVKGLLFLAASEGAELTANPLHPKPCLCWGDECAGSGYDV